MATLEEQMKKVQDDIKGLQDKITRVEALPEGHSERPLLMELNKQLTLLQEKENLLLKERAAAQQPVAVAAAQAAPAGPTDAQILEEIRQEFDGYKRFLKPVKAWVPATAWVLSFCVMLASMHRDHQNNDMKTLKEHLDKLKKVQSKFQQMRHVHPHAQTLKAEVGVVVSELESWYQAAEQWFRIH